jgi:multisubunit Na+/H+ antiporter MnhB subunit
MASIMDLAIQGGVVTVIGLVIFFAVFDGANTDSWGTTVLALVVLIPLVIAAVAVIRIISDI